MEQNLQLTLSLKVHRKIYTIALGIKALDDSIQCPQKKKYMYELKAISFRTLLGCFCDPASATHRSEGQ